MIIEKLDGVSVFCEIDINNNKIRLITRGDGEEGRDISFLIFYINIFKDYKQTIKIL